MTMTMKEHMEMMDRIRQGKNAEFYPSFPCDIVNGYWETRVYYFYTKREAIRLFRKEMKELRGKA